MAETKQKSRADKAVSDAKKKDTGKSTPKSTTKKDSGKGKKTPNVKTEYDSGLPASVIASAVCLCVGALFLIISIWPQGFLPELIQKIVFGLIGKVGFYVSIPVLFFLFYIHGFQSRQPVKMRTICLICVVLLCGCAAHLFCPELALPGGFGTITQLYQGGIKGTTGGVICGSIAILLTVVCGDVLCWILIGLCLTLCILGSVQLTIPSLIRAYRNRPRDDEFDEEEEDYEEPAQVVVNRIATRRIEQKQLRRQHQEEAAEEEYEQLQIEPLAPQKRQRTAAAPVRVIEETPEVPAPMPEPESAPVPVKNRPHVSRVQDMMSQIEGEIGAPVAAAGSFVSDSAESEPANVVDIRPVRVEADEEAFIPSTMPEFKREAPIPAAPKVEPKPKKSQSAEKSEKVTAKQAKESARQVAAEIENAQKLEKPEYCFPPINLLNPPMRNGSSGTDEMRENSRRLNETLQSFKIDAHIINVTRGPSVTRYEVELDKGVRFNKLTTHADDIALSLGAPSVRIAAVPGKISIVGIEVPNRSVTMVALREVIDSPEFEKSKSKSSFAVGKDIGGSCIIGNIAKMPHMLIAGTTGSGKSVCMNSIILSLLYKAGPEDVKLIMVDPKMVELANYNGIPHLMIPVVTDPKKAAGSLQWAVTEMMRRYKTMSDAGVRDLESYNSIVMSEGGDKVPQLIVIIDELADLMLVAAKEVEDSICRIAQMGRAAGIHLVIATQRPSADVITGLMKANIPSRIAFSVASAMESRIILDTQGAEKLVGKGDMLFAPIGSGKPLRVQGCFVSDAEVEAVTSYVKEHYVADYDQQVLKDIEKNAQQAGKKAPASVDADPTAEELEGDEMLPAAVEVILETGQASVSMLQRRLKLGYARAARIVDEMEEKGIVGPFQGSKPRAILITKEQWDAMNTESSDFDDFNDNYGVPEELD